MSLLRTTAKRVRKLIASVGSEPDACGESLSRLQKILRHRFNDPTVLRQALVHKSSTDSADRKGLLSNERLEFLGDAVLNCLVTEHLYRKYPEKSEGQLSKIKSLIVSRKILGDVAASIELGSHLILGQSERKSCGRAHRSIMSNAFEAVLGALYLDGGLEAVRELLDRTLFGRIDEFLSDKRYINYKSAILEMAQRDGLGIPRYAVVNTTGPEHAKQFTVRIQISGIVMGEGKGPNKKIAEQEAARYAMQAY
ncbi:MAG: ribonuclease III, partial [Chitinivibrionales bacterium]|nr:ribonuclease III [Chitinivibrionales bacterium]